MYNIGDILELNIEKNVFGGEGLAYFDDGVIFVPESLEGDIVKAEAFLNGQD